MSQSIKPIFIIILAISLVFVFITVYSPHFKYNYYLPFHYDEWANLNDAKNLVKNGVNTIFYPNFKENVIRAYYKFGFDIFLAEIEILTGLDLIKIYQFLPAFSAVITSLALFILVWQISGNYLSSLLSIYFFTFLKSNINILGLWFFVSSTFSFVFVLAMFYLLNKFSGTQNYRFIYLFCFLSFILLSFYPVTAIFIAPVVIFNFYLIADKSKNFVKLLTFYFISVIPVLILSLIFIFISRSISGVGSVETIKYHIFNLIFFNGWGGSATIDYSFPSFFGYIGTTFALIALFTNLKNKKYYLINFLAIWIIINLLLYKFLSFTLLLPYQRVFYLGLIIACILAVTGLNEVFRFLRDKFPSKKNLIFLIIFIMLLISFYEPIRSYYRAYYQMGISELVNKEDLDALDYIKNNYKDKSILAPTIFSVVIYPYTYNRTPFVSTIFTNNPIGNFESYDIFDNFLNGDDLVRKKIADIYKINLVYSQDEIKSSILKSVYDKNGRFIYEVLF